MKITKKVIILHNNTGATLHGYPVKHCTGFRKQNKLGSPDMVLRCE